MTAERDRARRRVRATQRRVGKRDAELQVVYARLREVDDDLKETRATMKHYMVASREQDRRLSEGRAILLDYPYHPHPRSFSRPGKSFFHDQLSAGDAAYADLLASIGPLLAPLADIPEEETESHLPFWTNPWLPPLDGMAIYGLLAHHRPRTYLEVGSGFSTKFARRAVQDHGLETAIVSIDPQPRAEVDDLCDEVIRQPYEETDLDVLDRLGPGDMFFVDNSHRSFTNSDVTVFFTETLPYLRPGVIYGLHDIFLPHDYPEAWNDRFYAEQYLLMSYLLGGAAGDSIHLSVHHVATTPALGRTLGPHWPMSVPLDPATLLGGGFWMVKA